MSEREDELEMISYDGEGRLEKRIKIKSICKLYRCCHHQTHVGPDITPQSYGRNITAIQSWRSYIYTHIKV
jgi:hypothetical protein